MKKPKVQYTIRNIPDRLDATLRERAAEYGQSLNEATLAAIRKGVGVHDEPVLHQVRFGTPNILTFYAFSNCWVSPIQGVPNSFNSCLSQLKILGCPQLMVNPALNSPVYFCFQWYVI